MTASGTASDYSAYDLTVLSNDLNLTDAGQVRVIDAYLKDANNQPAEGEVILVDFFDGSIGTLSSFNGTIDDVGHVSFRYTAPADISALDGYQIRIYMENNSSKEQNITIHVDDANYMIIPEQNVTVTALDQPLDIKVSLTRQEAGEAPAAAVGKIIVAEFLMPVYGTIAIYEAEVQPNGKATFKYTSPSRSLDINDTNVTFYYKDKPTVKGNTLLIFDAQVVNQVDRLYLLPDTLTIIDNNQIEEITIVTVNAANVGISTTVTLEEPTLNGVDYGYFDSSTVTTNANGRATVQYTAPTDIDSLAERNITVTESSRHIEENLSILFRGSIDENGTDYDISVEFPDTLAVDANDTIKVIIHKLSDPSVFIDNEDVHEVNVTSLFSNMLTFGPSDSSTTYSNDAVKTLNIETKTIAGVAIVTVTASVFNGDHDVILTKTVPVTIFSGPVTATSLFYHGTTTDPDNFLYINHYTLHAVDKYANPAREGLPISATLINGWKVLNSSVTVPGTGSIVQDTPDRFEDTTVDFSGANVETTDRLVVLPNIDRIDQSYLGSWSISDVLNAHTLELSEVYSGTTTDDLSYIIGNQSRILSSGDTPLAHIVDPLGTYLTDASGTAQLEISFDPLLAGHTVTLGAYVIDNGQRTGTSKIAQLRWGSYTVNPDPVTIDNDGSSQDVALQLGIGGSSPQHLIDLLIDSNSIIIDPVTACSLDLANSNLFTDLNGYISVRIDTTGVPEDGATCDITWNKSNGSIHREY